MNSDPQIDDLPSVVYLFPIDQFLLLPETKLSAAITNPRFCRIVDAAEAADGYIGVVQVRERSSSGKEVSLYGVGCLGRVHVHSRDEEKHEVTLEGVIRFRLLETMNLGSKEDFPKAVVDYREFAADLSRVEEKIEGLDLENFQATLIQMMEKVDPSFDLSPLKAMSARQLLRSLAQVIRLTPAEKQKILEAPAFKEMAEVFFLLLTMNFLTTTQDTSPPSQVN